MLQLRFRQRGLVQLGEDQANAPAALVSAFQGKTAREYLVGLGLWTYATVSFWLWWFDASHNIGTPFFVLTTAVLAWLNLLPAYFLVILGSASIPNHACSPPKGARVAMVVTKTPAEPFDVVRATLEGMLQQSFTPPYDVWLADEDPQPETITWCRDHGVRISTRRGRPDYHRPNWPRRTRSKEGNLAFFYDMFGYADYDFVAQFDADHVPAPTYLVEILRPFSDPSIGYVSAPSICDANARDSWSARGRLYAEGSLHGALQAGYTRNLAPLCIGSHYAVRTAALRQIGGLGPELAEDHSTTLLLNAAGWRGAHALNAIAHGDGPATFKDFATQEFQWARSLTTILFQYTPACLETLPWRLKAQFLFCQLWYPLFGAFMLLMFLLPIVALSLDRNMVGVTYPEFVIRFSTPAAILIVMAVWWKRKGLLRPVNTRLFSWEAILFLFARWPWALMGVTVAVYDSLRGRVAAFKVTPKGDDERSPLRAGVLLPYVALVLLSALPVIVLGHVEVARGFYLFAILNASIYTTVLAVVIFHGRRESGQPPGLLSQILLALAVSVTLLGIYLRTREGLPVILAGGDDILARLDLVLRAAAELAGVELPYAL
jgi:cellulose synthase (UDP-forming)